MTIQVKIISRSPTTQMAGTMADGTLKIQVAAPPEQGKANRELVRFLARHFKVDQSAVRILSGATSTRKLVGIDT